MEGDFEGLTEGDFEGLTEALGETLEEIEGLAEGLTDSDGVIISYVTAKYGS
jgi:hypothetical protein